MNLLQTLGGTLAPNLEELVISISEDVNILTANKTTLIEKAKTTANNAIDLGYDTEVYVYAKKMAEFTKQVIDVLKPHLDGKPLSSSNLFGCEILEKMQGTKYDFSGCNDSIYNELKADFDNLKAKIAEREKFLKGFTKTTNIINENTGEVEEINPPVRTGKLGIEVTIK